MQRPCLERAQEEVTKAFERGDLGKDQYMAFQREVEETRGTLNRYKADLSGLQSEQERLSTNTERLSKLFAATESSVDDYADVLGSRPSKIASFLHFSVPDEGPLSDYEKWMPNDSLSYKKKLFEDTSRFCCN